MNKAIRRSIKNKLLAAFGAVLALSFVLAAWGYYSMDKILDSTDLEQQIDEISIQVLELRQAEKNYLMSDMFSRDFFKTQRSRNLTEIDSITNDLLRKIEQLRNHPVAGSMNLEEEFDHISDIIEKYDLKMNAISKEVLIRGYEDWGYEGNFRDAIHDIENTKFPYQRALLLSLRRYEKDFVMRKDLRFKTRFDGYIEKFKEDVLSAQDTSGNPVFEENREAILNYLSEYQQKFAQYVQSQVKIGLNDESGLLGDLKILVDELEPIINRLDGQVKRKTASIIRNTLIFFLLVFIVQLIVGFLISVRFSTRLTRNIRKIRRGIVKLSEGEFPDKVQIETEDELAETQKATNNLIERIKTAAEFTKKIGDGQLEEKYDEKYNNDVLALALQEMHGKLQLAAAEDAKRNWATKGLAEFGEVIRNTENDLKQLCFTVISDLVKFIGANQGKIFVINDDDESYDKKEFLELYATYAWKRQKYEDQTILKGEGLPGQAWFEKKTIYLKEVPSDYVNITSGLGAAVPKAVLIVPLIVNDTVFGVIELASLHEIERYKIDFIEKLAEIIAASLSSVRINEKTKYLLEQSQQQSEEMKAQEEEMRQNMEELSATQEELGRKEKEYLKRIEDLETQVGQFQEEEGS